MKKVIIAFDGTNYPSGAFNFIRQLNEKSSVLVAGVFVPQLDYANLWSYAAASGGDGVIIPLLEKEDNKEVADNIRKFEEACDKNGIRYRVHKDFYDFALPELKRETRFADLMILSGETFYKEIAGANRFDYLRTALHQAECPVIIVPENFDFPSRNVLAYDGSEESMYALKQFAYIFPELAANDTTIVWAESDDEKEFPAESLIREFAPQHFPKLTFQRSDFDSRKYFSSWIAEQKGVLLVSGSYGRAGFFEAIRPSFVSNLIRDHSVPVFIAHK